MHNAQHKNTPSSQYQRSNNIAYKSWRYASLKHVESLHLLHASYSIRFDLNTISSNHLHSKLTVIAGQNCGPPDIFCLGCIQLALLAECPYCVRFLPMLQVAGKFVGGTAVGIPSIFVLLPKLIMVAFLYPHCHIMAPGKRAKIAMALTTAQPPSAPPPWSREARCSAYCSLILIADSTSKAYVTSDNCRASTTDGCAAVEFDGRIVHANTTLSGSLVLAWS